jgi:hypothetical protein
VTLLFAMQTPTLQNPLLQSVSEVQLVLQVGVLLLHWYVPQEAGVPAVQVPVPLQVGIGSSVPLEQLATPHWVPAPHCRQAPAPSQNPSFPQLVLAAAAQSLRTSVPETAGAH